MQYSLNVIFISLFVRLQFAAAFGRFHFAANSISIDSLVSGRIFEKVIRAKIYRDFFRPKMDFKVDLRMKVFSHPLWHVQILAHS